MLAAPLLDSSSGWACTAIRRSCSATGAPQTRRVPTRTPATGPATMVRVTEVRATPVDFPPGRYGRRRDPRRRRWVPVVAGLLIITAGLAVTLKLSRQYGVPPYQVGAVSVTDVTPRSVKISFEVRVPD